VQDNLTEDCTEAVWWNRDVNSLSKKNGIVTRDLSKP